MTTPPTSPISESEAAEQARKAELKKFLDFLDGNHSFGGAWSQHVHYLAALHQSAASTARAKALKEAEGIAERERDKAREESPSAAWWCGNVADAIHALAEKGST